MAEQTNNTAPENITGTYPNPAVQHDIAKDFNPYVVTLYGPDEQPFQATMQMRGGKAKVTGTLHEGFVALRQAHAKAIAEFDASKVFKWPHCVAVISEDNPVKVQQYMSTGTNAVLLRGELVQVATRMKELLDGAEFERPAEYSVFDAHFYREAARLLIDRKKLTPEQKALVESPVDSPFWKDQDIQDLKEFQDTFRRLLGL